MSGELQIIFEMYPDLGPRQAIFKACKDRLISTTARDHYLLDYPDQPAKENVSCKKKYTLAECQKYYDHFANKYWIDMSSEEIDLVLDSYDTQTKEMALAYLEMRGWSPRED